LRLGRLVHLTGTGPPRHSNGLLSRKLKPLRIHQDNDSQILKFGKPVKQSSRNGRKLIVVEIAKTLNKHQNNH